MFFWSQSWKHVCTCPQGIAQDNPEDSFVWGNSKQHVCSMARLISLDIRYPNQGPNLAHFRGNSFSGEKIVLPSVVLFWCLIVQVVTWYSDIHHIFWCTFGHLSRSKNYDTCALRWGLCRWAFPWWVALAVRTNLRTRRRLKPWVLRCRCQRGKGHRGAKGGLDPPTFDAQAAAVASCNMLNITIVNR